MNIIELITILFSWIVYAQGMYSIQLRITSYTNPSNKCAECSIDSPLQGPFGCCDAFAELESCEGEDRCDNYFRYCLRPYSTTAEEIGCSTGGSEVTSNPPAWSNFDKDTDFSRSQVLGLNNPLTMQELGRQWQGIQVYIESNDFDTEGNNEMIDMFTIDIPQSIIPGSPESSEMEVMGRFNLARITLRYRVLCQQFFYGNFCENFNECSAWSVVCQNNGECIDQENNFLCQCQPGFTGQFCQEIDYCYCNNNGECQEESDSICDCNPGYTGQFCETNINDCIGVNCSEQGECIDGANSFSCACDQGYTGLHCETDIDDCLGVTCSGQGQCEDKFNTFLCTCDLGFTGELCATPLQITGTDIAAATEELSTPALAGGIVGGVLIIILIFMACLIVGCALKQRGRKREELPNPDDYRVFGKDNPVYGAPMIDGFSTMRSQTISIISSSPSTGMGLQSHSALSASNEQIYAEPTHSVTSYRRDLSEVEHVFKNPIYHSTEDITNETETGTKLFSFVGSNGSYLSTLQQNECVI